MLKTLYYYYYYFGDILGVLYLGTYYEVAINITSGILVVLKPKYIIIVLKPKRVQKNLLKH